MNTPHPAYKGDDPFVFVCYSHEDKDEVYPEITWLQENGVNVWYDEGISAGRVWRAEVAQSILGASKFLFYISQASLESQHCAREVEYSLSQDIPIIPVYLDDSTLTPELDLVLTRVQALHRPDDKRYHQHLLDALTGSAGSPGLFTLRVSIEPNSIAVLPLLNIDGSEQTAIFSKGLVEDVIDRLARVPSLRVSSRGDSASLPADASSDDVRRRLRVAYFIQGSVRLTDERIRVVIQLIESAGGRQLQSRRFDRARGDFFEIQDEITSLAIASVRVALPEDTQRALEIADNVASSIDAYVLYRRGIEELHKPMTVQTTEHALDWFNQSLKLDPGYAAAHAGICLAYASGFKFVGDTNYISEAEKACAAALELNPNLSVVHIALGDLYRETGRHSKAEQSYRRALEINPNDASALAGLALVYSGQQKWVEAEEKFRQVIALQPGSWESYNALGRFYYQRGRYEEAAAAFEQAVSLDADNVQGLSNLGTSMMLAGNIEGARPAFDRAISVEPHATAYANLGLVHYYLGNFDSAVDALKNATDLAPNDHLAWLNLADALSFAKQQEAAAQTYAKAERLAENRLKINRADIESMMDLAWAKAALGKTEDARELAEKAKRSNPDDPYMHYIRALVLTRQDDQTGALEELSLAVEMGYPPAILAAEPHLRSLRNHPQFAALLQGQGTD